MKQKFINKILKAITLSQIYWLPRYYTLFKFVTLKKGELLLDAGCGAGVVSMALARRGVVVIALDISLDKIIQATNFAKELNIKNKIYFIQGDLARLPLKNNSFDKIVSLDTLEFIENETTVLKEFFNVLKPAAKVFLTLPAGHTCNANLFSAQRLLRRLVPRYLFSKNFPGAKAWFEIDTKYIMAKMGDLRIYSLLELREKIKPFFELSGYAYFSKLFSSLAIDITYGIKGVGRLKGLILLFAVRLDYFFYKRDKGYALFLELIRK